MNESLFQKITHDRLKLAVLTYAINVNKNQVNMTADSTKQIKAAKGLHN